MKVCYTTITNNYDILKDPEYITPNWQYVVFADRHYESDVWECVITDKPNREIKIKGHVDLFKSLTLYVDGSIQIKGDLNVFISKVPNWFTLWKHPFRHSVYQEGQEVAKLKGIPKGRVKQQMNKYKKEGFPYHFGLYACGVMLRDFNDSEVRRLCDEWWEEFEKWVPRDQLSLPYVLWKNGYKADIFDQSVFDKYFHWGKHL